MMLTIISILFILFVAFLNYFFINRKLLSPTIISCICWDVFLMIYIIFYQNILYELSVFTYLIIIMSIIFTLIGEYFATKIYFVKKKTLNRNLFCNKKRYIKTSKYITYLIFLGSILIAIYRFYDLYKFSLTLGNNSGIFNTIASTRLAYALGEYTGGNLIISLLTITCEISCYAYIFILLNNSLIAKKVDIINALPIVGYFFIIISFTNRTEYLRIGFAFITILLYFVYSYYSIYNKKNKIFKKIILFCGIIVIFFFGYGNLTRGQSEDESLANNIVAYSSGALVGLDQYLLNGWEKNPYFGYYTLQEFYSFFNVQHNIEPQHHLTFFSYNIGRSQSNIYTSLVLPIQDYGIIGMLISRLFIAFLATKIFNYTLQVQNIKKLIVMLTITCLFGYMYLNVGIADRFCNYLLSPSTIIKYTLVSYIVIMFLIKFKSVNISQN